MPSTVSCRRSRWPRFAPNVFAGTPSMSSFALVPELARCPALSECSGSCCVPNRDPGSPMLPVFADSPKNDSLPPCGQPKPQLHEALAADPEFYRPCQHSFRRLSFGTTSTEFPARRSSRPVPGFCAQAFSLWSPIAGVGRRSSSEGKYHK